MKVSSENKIRKKADFVFPEASYFFSLCGRSKIVHNTCQVVDAIYEGIDAAVENGGEVEDVTQDWMDLGEKGHNILF